MKKLLLLLSAIILSIGVNAQKGKVNAALSYIDQGALDKAKESIDEAIKNEKSKDWTKTYYAIGKLAMASFESENPKFKTMYKDPLNEAYAAFEKAMQLDPKGGTKKLLQVNSTYLVLGNMFINQGVERFQKSDFKGALDAFENNLKISSTDVYVGLIDTGIIFNAGLAAYNAKMFDKAIEYFEACTPTNYEGTQPYQLMYLSYMGKEDMESAEKMLNRAFERFPGNQEVLLVLIQHYLDNDLTDKGLASVDVALEKDPENFSLHLAKGVFFMKLERYDDAVVSLEKSASIKADEFATQLNLGISYYNIAFEMYLKSNEIMDVQKYNAAVAEVNKVFTKAVAPFEEAHRLKPDDIDTMKNLKELYYRLQMNDKYEAISKKLEGKL